MKKFLNTMKWVGLGVVAGVWTLIVILVLYMAGALLGSLGFGVITILLDLFVRMFQVQPSINLLFGIVEGVVTILSLHAVAAVAPSWSRVINLIIFMIAIFGVWTDYTHPFLMAHGLTR